MIIFLEYIEIFNQSDHAIDISNWRIDNAITYYFPQGTIIGSQGSIVVIGFDPDNSTLMNTFKSNYNVKDNAVIIGQFTGSLSNNSERIQLERPDSPPSDDPDFTPYILQDEVDYNDDNGWPGSADGLGNSLHRTISTAFGNYASSWIGAIPTPGRSTLVNTLGDLDGDSYVDSDDLALVKEGLGNQFSLSDLFNVRNSFYPTGFLNAAMISTAVRKTIPNIEPQVNEVMENNILDLAGGQLSLEMQDKIGSIETKLYAVKSPVLFLDFNIEVVEVNELEPYEVIERKNSSALRTQKQESYNSLYQFIEDDLDIWLV